MSQPAPNRLPTPLRMSMELWSKSGISDLISTATNNVRITTMPTNENNALAAISRRYSRPIIQISAPNSKTNNRAPRTMTVFSLDRSPARREGDFGSKFVVTKLGFVGQPPRLGRAGHTPPLCGGHPLQRHQPTDVVGKVLQADFSLRPRDADRSHDPATRRGLLSTEHVLDASPNFALLAVRVLLRLR